VADARAGRLGLETEFFQKTRFLELGFWGMVKDQGFDAQAL
jgi:hypothetical protein